MRYITINLGKTVPSYRKKVYGIAVVSVLLVNTKYILVSPILILVTLTKLIWLHLNCFFF